MRVAIFFAYLCFLLLRGEGYAFTATHHNDISNSFARNVEHKHRIKFTDTNQDNSVVSNLDNEEECLISDDIEEEDANNFLARKYKLLARYYLTLPDLDVLSYLHKCFKAPTPYLGHLSNRYITQSVLRI
ncbi:hypothetical protein AB6805_17235 [Chitinophaga sp. RCC_12]|uniref:hypothetical protein n=1 Tax=unclassified Chitinophaga TaxID=2619133 RepID=UPI00352666DA